MTTKNEFLAALEDRSWEVRRAADGAVVLAPSPPVEADELWVPADDEAPYHDAIDELGTRDVIEFWWDDGMPASTAEIAVFDGPTRSYVSLAPDQDRDLAQSSAQEGAEEIGGAKSGQEDRDQGHENHEENDEAQGLVLGGASRPD